MINFEGSVYQYKLTTELLAKYGVTFIPKDWHFEGTVYQLELLLKKYGPEHLGLVSHSRDARIPGQWYNFPLPPAKGNWLHDNEDQIVGEQSILYQFTPDKPGWVDPIGE